jgi:hypothetical protein
VILKIRHVCESGASSSAASRPRKSSTRKSKPAEQDSTPVVDASAEAEPLLTNTEGKSQQSIESVAATSGRSGNPSLVNNFQEDRIQMNPSHVHESWQEELNENGESVHVPHEEGQLQNGQMGDEVYFEDEHFSDANESVGQNQNQILLTLSYSLMNHVRQVARMEGVFPEDILIELIAEGVTRRVFEDAQRPAPSHLMTRTGYMAPDVNGNVQQPHLSHHGMQMNQRGNHQGHNNNRRFNQNNNRGNHGGHGNHFQGRNRQNQFKNKQRNGNGNGNGK